MQKAEIILTLLRSKSHDQSYVYKRIYRNLYNLTFYDRKYLDQANRVIDLLKLNKIADILKNEVFIKTLIKPIKSILGAIFYDNLSQSIVSFKRYSGVDKIKTVSEKLFWDNSSYDRFIIGNLLGEKIDDHRFCYLVNELVSKIKKSSWPFQCMKYDFSLYEIIEHLFYQREIDQLFSRRNYYLRFKNNILYSQKGSEEYVKHIESLSNVSRETSDDFSGFKVASVKLIDSKFINNITALYTKENKPIHLTNRLYMKDSDIIRQYCYEKKIIESYFYSAQDKYRKIKKFKYFHYRSLLKTLARKHKTSVPKIKSNYHVNY